MACFSARAWHLDLEPSFSGLLVQLEYLGVPVLVVQVDRYGLSPCEVQFSQLVRDFSPCSLDYLPLLSGVDVGCALCCPVSQVLPLVPAPAGTHSPE